jgi:hypothetical protein
LQLEIGAHEISLSHPGYESLQEQIDLQPGINAPRRYSLVKLAGSIVGGLRITSTPPDAAVTLDDALVGSTPFEDRDLTPGRHRVIVSKEGFENYSGVVLVRAGQTTPINIILTPVILAGGQLVIKSNPEGATIFLDDAEMGATPKELNVAPGPHQILLRKNGFEDYTRSINIVSQQRFEIDQPLTALIGRLRVMVKPFGAIYIDGQMKKEETNTQYSIDLSAGAHELSVIHPQFKWRSTIEIKANQTQNVRIDFNQPFSLTVTAFDFATNTAVPKAEIYVDNKFVDFTPKVLSLSCGLHKIVIRRQGYITAEKEINLENNWSTPLKFMLKKNEQ